MSMEKYYWSVSCGERHTEAVAVDKLRAIQGAAMQWGLPWTNIARACVAVRGAEAKEETEDRPKPGKRSSGKKQK